MTEEVKKKRTPKRKLKDISFDHEGAHLALVSDQLNGGPANLQPNALFLKAIEGFSEEILEKASQVTVTLAIEEFLEKFFDVEEDDAEVLARALGYTTEMQDKIAAGETPDLPEAEEGEDPEFASLDEYEAYIRKKISSYKIMKAMKDASGDTSVMANLSGEDYLALLQDQAQIEKAFDKVAELKKATKVEVRKESDLKASASGSDTQHGNGDVTKNASVEKKVEPSGSVSQVNKGNYMADKEVKTVVADVEKELVEKSVLVDLQKAFDEKAVELQKALDLVKQFEQEKKDAITKARKEKLGAAVKNEEQAAALFKGANLLEDADFEAFVKAVADIQAVADQSDLFKSVGADGVVEQKAEEGVSDIKKAFAKLKAQTK